MSTTSIDLSFGRGHNCCVPIARIPVDECMSVQISKHKAHLGDLHRFELEIVIFVGVDFVRYVDRYPIRCDEDLIVADELARRRWIQEND